jgi:hypothetical protein
MPNKVGSGVQISKFVAGDLANAGRAGDEF